MKHVVIDSNTLSVDQTSKLALFVSSQANYQPFSASVKWQNDEDPLGFFCYKTFAVTQYEKEME